MSNGIFSNHFDIFLTRGNAARVGFQNGICQNEARHFGTRARKPPEEEAIRQFRERNAKIADIACPQCHPRMVPLRLAGGTRRARGGQPATRADANFRQTLRLPGSATPSTNATRPRARTAKESRKAGGTFPAECIVYMSPGSAYP